MDSGFKMVSKTLDQLDQEFYKEEAKFRELVESNASIEDLKAQLDVLKNLQNAYDEGFNLLKTELIEMGIQAGMTKEESESVIKEIDDMCDKIFNKKKEG